MNTRFNLERMLHIACVITVACGGGNKEDKGCAGAHENLVATEPAQLSPENTLCAGSSDPDCQAKDEDAAIVLTSDNFFQVTWLSNRDGNDDIYTMRSQDGITWEEPVRITSHADGDWYPTLLEYQTETARFHLVWMRQQATPPYARHIYYNSSPDGITWDSANEKALTNGLVDDFVPTLLEQEGELVVYFDTLAGRSTTSTRDFFTIRSSDGGATWSEPTDVSSLNSADTSESFLFVRNMAFSTSLIGVFIRYGGDAANPAGFLDPSTALYYATSSDNGATWGSPALITRDPGNEIVDSIPSLYYGNETTFTWLQGVGNEPHIMELPLSAVASYPNGVIDITEETGALGWSPRVTRSAKPGFFMRTWTNPDYTIYFQVFETTAAETEAATEEGA